MENKKLEEAYKIVFEDMKKNRHHSSLGNMMQKMVKNHLCMVSVRLWSLLH